MSGSTPSGASAAWKWLAGIVVILIGAALIYWFIHTVGPFNPFPSTPTASPQAPHAPPITGNFGTPLYNEKATDFQVQPGQPFSFIVRNYWSAPANVTPSCATGIFVFTWQVRQPYPSGGSDLEFRRVVPQGGGQTESLAHGSTGSASVGYCDELFLDNNSKQDYTVEIRYASGNYTP